MAEFADHEWEIEDMSIVGLFQRFEAARLRREERAMTTAVLIAQIHNTGLAIRAPWVKNDPAKPVKPSDLIGGGSARTIDEAAFHERERVTFQRIVRRLLTKGYDDAVGYATTRRGRDRRLLLDAVRVARPETTEERAALNRMEEVLA